MKQKTKIVIVGNGFGGTYVLRDLHKYFHKHKNVELTLIGEKNYFLFTPLLHEVATGGINPENIVEPIRKVFGCCLDKFYLGKVDSIETKNNIVKVGSDIIPYDYLVLAPGAETNFFNIPGAQEHTFTLKSINDAMAIKNHLVTQMERASHTENDIERRKILNFVIVGGGPSGVEVTAEVRELVTHTFSRYYSPELIKDTSVTLIQRDTELLPMFGPKIRQKSLQVLRKKGINVMLESIVEEVGAEYVKLQSGQVIDTETIIWVAGIKPRKIDFDTEVNKTPDGKMIVNEFLQVENIENIANIFALGDVVAFKVGEKGFLPTVAQVATKEAMAVAENLRLLIVHKPMKKFIYKSKGNLVSLGQWMAAGEISNVSFYGHIAWWLWRTVYLSKMITFRKKVKVAIDWTINIFSPRDISQI